MRKSRFSKILDSIIIDGPTKISELANKFYVSEMTIRRDIKELEARDLVELKTGVVSLKTPLDDKVHVAREYSVDEAKNFMFDEKVRIARKVGEIIKENEVIMLDNGSTMQLIAHHIPQDKEYTFITTNFNAFQKLIENDKLTLILTGGLFHRDTSTLESDESIQLINKFRGNRVFISGSGVHSDLGVTCNKMYEMDMKRSLLNSAIKKYLVVDSSKYDLIHAYHFADVSDFDCVITDKGISKEWIEHIESLGIELIIV